MYINKIIIGNKKLTDRIDHLLWLDYKMNLDETLVFNKFRKISVIELRNFTHEQWIDWLYE